MISALGPDVVARRLLAGGAPEELTALQADAEQLPRVLEALRQRGLLLGVELAEGIIPGVQVTLVFPGGGGDEVRPAMQSAVRLATRLAEIKLSERVADGRTLLEGGFLGLGRLAYWQEGAHFVVTIGTMPTDTAIALADGKGDSLVDNPRWKELCSFNEYETYARAQVDTERLQRILTQWVAPAKPILEQLGVDTLTRVSLQLGVEGRYQRLTAVLDTPTERRGVLRLLADGPSLDLKKLPALPPDASTVWTLTLEPGAAYLFGIETIEKILSVVQPGEVEAFRGDRAKFESALGGEAMTKALAALGPTLVAYNEPGGAIPLFGGALAIEIKDAAAFEQARRRHRGLGTSGPREFHGGPARLSRHDGLCFPVEAAVFPDSSLICGVRRLVAHGDVAASRPRGDLSLARERQSPGSRLRIARTHRAASIQVSRRHRTAVAGFLADRSAPVGQSTDRSFAAGQPRFRVCQRGWNFPKLRFHTRAALAADHRVPFIEFFHVDQRRTQNSF